MSQQADQYAVFGNPIKHSKSPLIHALFAEETKQNLEYRATFVEEDSFVTTATKFFSEGGKGLNITVPFKLDAFDFANDLGEIAQKAGAVNTLWQKEGVIYGSNTDGTGLVRDIKDNLGWVIAEKDILILGAGGAVRGVIASLLAEKPRSITIVNRTVEKAEKLAEQYEQKVSGMAYDALGNTTYDIIINGTSASLSGEQLALNDKLLSSQTCCYDMMYEKELTLFLQWAKKKGVSHLAEGLGMLVEQAAESFFLWRNIRPSTAPVIKTLKSVKN